MKHKLRSILLGVVLFVIPGLLALGFGGCTNTGTTGGGTNSPPVTNNTPVNPLVIGSVSLVLHGAALAGTSMAIQSDPNNKQYFQLAAQALGALATGRDYTPAAFQAALLNVSGVTNLWVSLVVGSLTDSYQFYFASYVQGTVNGNAYAKAFIGAIEDGTNEALGNPVTHNLAGRRARQAAIPVLPRPINPRR